LRERIRDVLEREVGLTIERLTPFVELPERAIYRADSSGGPSLIVRVFPPSRPVERVRGDFAILEHAVSSAIPAERPVAVAQLDDRGVLITEHVNGRPLTRTAATLRQLGEIAGRLSAWVPVPDHPYLSRRAGSLPVEDLAYARAELDSVRAAVPAIEGARFESLAAALEATHDCEDLPRALIHPDCQLTNAIADDKERIVMIDWDGAGVGPRLVSLGLVLYSAVVQAPGERHAPADLESRSLDLARVDPIMEGFVRYGSFAARELDRLADLIRFRALAIAVRQFKNAVREGRRYDGEGWWSRYPEADVVATWARAALAEHLERALASG
jgi:Ser/Thr protein kinase RdoA (MazF antagonist)